MAFLLHTLGDGVGRGCRFRARGLPIPFAGLGFRVEGLGFRVEGLGFRVQHLKSKHSFQEQLS